MTNGALGIREYSFYHQQHVFLLHSWNQAKVLRRLALLYLSQPSKYCIQFLTPLLHYLVSASLEWAEIVSSKLLHFTFFFVLFYDKFFQFLELLSFPIYRYVSQGFFHHDDRP